MCVKVFGRVLKWSNSRHSAVYSYPHQPQVDTLMNLCHAIFVARERGELALEEDLVAILIQIYRSPEAIITWTAPSLLEET